MSKGAPKGNQFWKLRKDMTEAGRKLTPEQVLEKAQEYINRCVEERISEIDFRGKNVKEVVLPRMIVMSIAGLCHHLGIVPDTFYEWKKDEKYSYILTRVENLMTAYNLEGAGANQINQNIVARLEGLKDRTDVTSNNKGLTVEIAGKTFEF